MRSILFLTVAFLLVQTSISEAQTTFVQGRYFGTPNSIYCDSCMPQLDGIVHIRFKPGATRVFRDGSDDKFEFTVQLRHAGDQERYLNIGGFRLTYNEAVFGARLNTPPIIQDFALNPAAQCAPTRGSLIADEIEYDLNFADSFSDELNITAISADATQLRVDRAPRDNFSLLTSDWQDLLTMTCTIPSGNTNAEADVAISGTEPIASSIREFPETGRVANNRPPVLLPDNDLRGFRLDGKTYAEDYARYGDGTGVRVKFSKGISTALTVNHFVFEDDVDGTLATTPTVANVIHTAGSVYANIEFDQTVNSGVLRLISTQTTVVVNDEDNMPLADGSFIAALHYDARAPRVVGIQKISGGDTPAQSTSTWSISFTQPINSATVNARNLCITGDDGICPPDAGTSQMAPFIMSATMDERHTTQLIVVIEEGDGEAESIRSLEFRRNAVLGTDIKIVEDYQTALRDQIKLEDRIEPVMTITGLKAKIIDDDDDDPTTIRYRASFIVHASEPVSGLFIASSYNLLREVDSKWVPVLSHVFNLFAAEITEVSDADGQIIVGRTAYVFVDVDLSIDQATSTTAFALARAGDAMQDSSGQSPQTGPDGLLDPDHIQTARSEIDRTSPIIEVEAQRVANIENRDDTNVTYGMNFTVFAIDNQEEKTRENLGHIDQAGTYELLRVLNDNSTATISVAPSEVQVTSATAVVRYTGVQLSVAESERTKGFTLGLGSGNVLTDESGNPPVDVNGRLITYRTRIDPRDSAIARVILRINIRTKVFLEGTID